MPETVNNKFELSYKGEINYDNIGTLLNQLKKKMDKHGFRLGAYKKVLAVMVECLENIYKYLDSISISKDYIENYQPYFNLDLINNYFELKAGNPIRKQDVARLDNKLSKINSLNEMELKHLYKKIITDGQFTEKGGAGLGFIEMVKTTGNKIGYKIEEVNNDISFFHIILKIPVK